MKNTYLIPHNYTNNGRIFNMIEKPVAVKALCWLIPACLIIYLAPLNLTLKFALLILIGLGPAMIFVVGLDLIMLDIISFSKNAKVYYDLKEDNDDEYYYELAKQEELQNSKADKKSQRAYTDK